MKRLKLQGGAELVEFALVLPVLLLVVFGIVDFSLLLYDKAVVTNAAREGARAGVVFFYKEPPVTWPELEAQITSAVESYCSEHLISSGTPTVTFSGLVDVLPAGPSSGDTIPVKVEFLYNYVVLGSFVPSLGPLTLTSTAVMRHE